MKKIILVLLLIVGLAGCANTGPMKPEQKAGIHNVAIVSLLGDQLEFTKVGFTVFNNDYFVRDTSSWELDSNTQKTIANALQISSPDIKVVDVPFNRALLFKIYKSPDSWGDYASLDRIEAELKSKLSETPVDAIILVYKQSAQDPVAFTSVHVRGFGVFYRTLPFVDSLMKPYAIFSIEVLDGKTLKPIARKYAVTVSKQFGKTQISWDDQLKNNLSEAMLKDFQSDLDSMITDNIKSSLKELGL